MRYSVVVLTYSDQDDAEAYRRVTEAVTRILEEMRTSAGIKDEDHELWPQTVERAVFDAALELGVGVMFNTNTGGELEYMFDCRGLDLPEKGW